jgi:hypothetical protein
MRVTDSEEKVAYLKGQLRDIKWDADYYAKLLQKTDNDTYLIGKIAELNTKARDIRKEISSTKLLIAS